MTNNNSNNGRGQNSKTHDNGSKNHQNNGNVRPNSCGNNEHEQWNMKTIKSCKSSSSLINQKMSIGSSQNQIFHFDGKLSSPTIAAITNTRNCRSKLRKMIRNPFGHQNSKSTNSINKLDGDIMMPCSPKNISDQEHQEFLDCHDSESLSELNMQNEDDFQSRLMPRDVHLSSPKIIHQSFMPTMNDHHRGTETSSPSSMPIRVIKPMAIRPQTSTATNYDDNTQRPPRDEYPPSSNSSDDHNNHHTSAFYQVGVISQPQKQRQNYHLLIQKQQNNPYSNPLSMESIETEEDELKQEQGQQEVLSNSEEAEPLQLTDNNLKNSVLDDREPIHMTLEEVRRIAFGSPERFHSRKEYSKEQQKSPTDNLTNIEKPSSYKKTTIENKSSNIGNGLGQNAKTKIKNLFDNLLNKTPSCMSTTTGSVLDLNQSSKPVNEDDSENSPPSQHRSPVFVNHLRDLLCHHQHHSSNSQPNLSQSSEQRQRRRSKSRATSLEQQKQTPCETPSPPPSRPTSSPFIRRALPPVPLQGEQEMAPNATTIQQCRRYQSLQRVSRNQFKSMSEYERKKYLDYVSSIERVKNCGWYWGPISGVMAEKLLAPEPCGSFLVRDSSDEHYIFSLSFKLDGMVRHVRIEQEQGNFSFGSLKKFRSSTIVEFINSAMEHSRSGQFLFFLRLGPELGPIRVQLLYPVSRLKRVQSLQHICRFVILQYVRRDQIHELALPECLRRYLDTPYYYSEELAQMQMSNDNDLGEDDVDSLNRRLEQTRQRELIDLKRRLFMETDTKTLMEKMLIDRRKVEEKLMISIAEQPKPETSQTIRNEETVQEGQPESGHSTQSNRTDDQSSTTNDKNNENLDDLF